MDYPEDTRDYLSEAVQTVAELAETARCLMGIPGQRDRARAVMNMAAEAIDCMEAQCMKTDEAGPLVVGGHVPGSDSVGLDF